MFKNTSQMNESEQQRSLQNMANQFLDYFFDDEQVDGKNESIKNMRLLIKEKTRFIQQPSS